MMEWWLAGESRCTREKPTPVPPYSSHIWHGLPCDWNQACVEWNRPLISWVMTQFQWCDFVWIGRLGSIRGKEIWNCFFISYSKLFCSSVSLLCYWCWSLEQQPNHSPLCAVRSLNSASVSRSSFWILRLSERSQNMSLQFRCLFICARKYRGSVSKLSSPVSLILKV
jgi:hypothetical protein